MHLRVPAAARRRASLPLRAPPSPAPADQVDADVDVFALLDASPGLRYLRHLHARFLRTALYADVALSSRLVLAYSRHGALLASAYPAFLHMPCSNACSWSIIIGEMSRSGFPRRALALFAQMRALGVPVDAFTAPIALRSCAAVGASAAGAAGHGLCIKLGLERNPYVASALVFLYAALGWISDARYLFDEMPHRDVVVWTAMLSGYAQCGEPQAALEMFKGMVGGRVGLDGVVMVSLLLACSQLGWLRHGKSVHGFSERRCLGSGLSLGNALVDMYVKCGALRCAERVFGRMPRRDVISWSSLVMGHGLNGHAGHALELFERMNADGVRPNSVTFLGVLSACAHAGLVEKAWEFWDMMEQHGVCPELKHYACMVDVLGRAGQLLRAERFVEEMPVEPDEAVWGALLAACRIHGEVEVAERVAKRLLGLRPDKSGYYVLLANVYSDAGRYEDAARVRDLMKQMNVGKSPGHSSVESGGHHHSSQLQKNRNLQLGKGSDTG